MTFGVYKSTDRGDSWFWYGMDSVYVCALCLSPDEKTIYAGITFNLFPIFRYGVYKMDIVTDVKTTPEVGSDFYLSQNYPNPFNPSTTIRYYLPEAARVKVTILDLLGQEIKTLVDGYQQAGEKKVYFDGSSSKGRLPSGVYFYRIQAGKYFDVKKSLLIK
jgi:hypothetical protein